MTDMIVYSVTITSDDVAVMERIVDAVRAGERPDVFDISHFRDIIRGIRGITDAEMAEDADREEFARYCAEREREEIG